MSDNDTGEELVFYLDRWLATDQDDGQTCREMPVIRKGTLCLPGNPIIMDHKNVFQVYLNFYFLIT